MGGWNVLVNAAGSVITVGAGFAYQILLARYLRPEGFGLYSEATAVAVLASTMGGFGTGQLTIRELARRGKNLSVLPTLLTLAAVGGMILGLAVVGGFAMSQEPISAYAIIAASVPFTAMTGVLVGVFVARDNFAVPAIVQGGGVALLAVLVVVGIAVEAPLLYFLAAWASVEAVRFGVLTSRLSPAERAPFGTGWRTRSATISPLLREAVPYGLLALIGVVHLRVDVVMVRWLAGIEDAGIYSGAARFSYALAIVPSLLLQVLFPRFVRLRESNEAARLFLTAAKVLFWTGCAAGALGVALSGPIVDTFLGSAYAQSAAPLRLLMGAVVFTFVQAVTGTVLASGRDLRSVTALAFGVTALNVVANALLIPKYGAAGAAGATLLSEAVSLLGYARLACTQLEVSPSVFVRALTVPRLTRRERALLLQVPNDS